MVFSSIDLWKGCIALVPEDFDGALVTKEFPIYPVRDGRLSPAFLQALLRSRYISVLSEPSPRATVIAGGRKFRTSKTLKSYFPKIAQNRIG